MRQNPEIPLLGRVQSVDLRQVWPSEPSSFTPWLAQPENLQFLAETLGLPGLELVATEHQIDIFSADIVARAADSGETVLIENQIDPSDHKHLGQILTYSAGLEAAIIVWIAKRFTEGHRAALDWLNRMTPPEIAFFGIEVEAIRIGESLPAPRFTVVARPNEWVRSLKAISENPAMQQYAATYMRYWDGYEAEAQKVDAPIRRAPQQIRTTNYYAPAGLRGVYYSAWKSTSSRTVGAYLSMFGDDAERVFNFLQSRAIELEQGFGGPLEWQIRRQGATYWIVAGKIESEQDETDWPRQHRWLAETLRRLKSVLAAPLRELPPENATTE